MTIPVEQALDLLDLPPGERRRGASLRGMEVTHRITRGRSSIIWHRAGSGGIRCDR